MTNKEIAKSFQMLAKLMEFHGENPFKIRSYQTAYNTLRKLDRPLTEMTMNEIGAVKGIGKAITGKIGELLGNGVMDTLERYKEQTPEGIQEMLQIKGFGPKKVKTIWDSFGIETIGELLYAVNENRLVELKGFGQKTQAELKTQLEYFQRSKNQYHFATLEPLALELVEHIQQTYPDAQVALTGALRRCANTLEQIEIIIGYEGPIDSIFGEKLVLEQNLNANLTLARIEEYPVHIYRFEKAVLGSKQFRYSASQAFLDAFIAHYPQADFKGLSEEQEVFEKVGLPFIPAELRENPEFIDQAGSFPFADLIQEDQILGVIHTHSTYSDGIHTLKEMVEEAQNLGYQYIGITDHSQSAFYANGLKPERLLEQMAEIDALNAQLSKFKVLKGIESDILNDGSLDYEETILAQLDFVIASVHSNLKMDEAKATARIIKAIENPYTSILGHPTGRLLLSRPGYRLDHRKVIDACAANQVAIELNANPYRLDLDWTYIPYAMEKGVKISINPDAHSKIGIKDIHFGVLSARKGGLTVDSCLNAGSVDQFLAFCSQK